MNVYAVPTPDGHTRLVYGNYLKAKRLSANGKVYLVTCQPDDVRFGRVRLNDLPIY